VGNLNNTNKEETKMRESRKEHLLPLQAGVPYKMANGERRVFDCIEDIAFNGYDLTTGQHTSARHLDIDEFYMEDGVWITHSYGNVVVSARAGAGDGNDYPLQATSMVPEYKRLARHVLTSDGYEYMYEGDNLGVKALDIIGYIKPLPKEQTANYAWFRDKVALDEYVLVHDSFPIAWNTGAHMSTTEPDLVAYFPTQKHWDNRVPQKIKAGRYLKKYFDLDDDEIRQKASLLTGGHRTLKVLTHWYDMFVAYRTLDVNNIVSSCMTKDCWRPVHPLMVYHESDVVLVVMYEGDEPKARALTNKNTKEFNIIYGQWERMLPMLNAAGYTHGSLDGAKINKLQRYPYNVRWDDLKESIEGIRTTEYSNLLMPYIDGHRDHSRGCNNATSVNLYDDYVEINHKGDYVANDYENAQCFALHLHSLSEWCELCEENFPYGDGYYLEHESITCCGYCYHNRTVRVITHVSATRGNSWEVVTEYYARDNCTYVDETTEWYMSTDVANQAGWVYSDYHDCWMDKDDCVHMEDGDWISEDEEGIVFTYDKEEGEYVYIPKDTKTLDIVDHTTALAA
jgi:hypothetical protein